MKMAFANRSPNPTGYWHTCGQAIYIFQIIDKNASGISLVCCSNIDKPNMHGPGDRCLWTYPNYRKQNRAFPHLIFPSSFLLFCLRSSPISLHIFAIDKWLWFNGNMKWDNDVLALHCMARNIVHRRCRSAGSTYPKDRIQSVKHECSKKKKNNNQHETSLPSNNLVCVFVSFDVMIITILLLLLFKTHRFFLLSYVYFSSFFSPLDF